MPQGELVIKRTFRNVSAERVYDAWTDPTIMAQWYGPEGMRTEVHAMDLRAGGAYRLTMHAGDGSKFPLRGQFRELDRPRKLVFSWQWVNTDGPEDSMGQGEETLVTVAIRAAGADAVLTLTHSGFASAEAVAQHQIGWDSTMTKLESQLAV